MQEPPPYRDERASLQAEITRLHGEVDALRGQRWNTARRIVAAVVLLAVDLFCFMRVEGWVNARDDRGFVWAVATVLTLVVVHVAVAQRAFSRRA